MKTRLIILGDTHCGHLLGLTPHNNIIEFQLTHVMMDLWNWFCKEIRGKWDIAFWMGDLIDGEAKKDHSHLLFSNIKDQIKIAQKIIKKVNAKQNIFLYGTPYHTGVTFDWEDLIAEPFDGDIDVYQKKSIQGINFDLAHWGGGKSNTPTGGDIALKKELLWTILNDLIINVQGKADYVYRAHIHENRQIENDLGTAGIIPALKIGYPKFDRYARNVRGWYSVGFREMIIDEGRVMLNYYHKFSYQIYREYEELCGK